jgi:bifunctional non-homologous end joining protein LigD
VTDASTRGQQTIFEGSVTQGLGVGTDCERRRSGGLSRRGNVYKRFAELAAAIHIELDCQAVLDGEIVCLDENGRPQFYDLLRRRGEPVFYAFDLLWLNGEDLRSRPLIERKRRLRSIVPEQPSVILSAEHIERDGIEFFRLACEQDLEGVVAKLKQGAYGEKWFKILNPGYSHYEGRRELFESRRRAPSR